MNERIKELKNRAFEMTEWENLDYDVILERFGELIVRECAEVASAPLAFTDAAYCRVGLLKHFGIEK